MSEIELTSTVGINYSKLRDHLAEQDWKNADELTKIFMLLVAGTKKQSINPNLQLNYLDMDCINNFPCTDLHTIDKLWTHYSNNRFGFSVQKRIWDSLGGSFYAQRDTWRNFGDLVGWRDGSVRGEWGGGWFFYEQLDFSLTAPLGQFPVAWTHRESDWKQRHIALMQRLVSCGKY
ncbi:GUN4 domain-containing protein [Aerosakkonemataceae cyanobacterium BLCC-F154]|uniref:GUN4 domain-containing protein n=1 Tax=Floridaenema fluviatile BLCC-F154 TaxID=3153640 RepID=A0ABV4YFD6_9CYAN